MTQATAERVCLVTGGAQGIGRELSRRFAERGERVVIVDQDAEALDELSRELRQAGRQVVGVVGDVCQAHVLAEALEATTRGGAALATLINNAGVSRFHPLLESSVEDFRAVLEINLIAAFAFSRACAPELRRHRGCILNIASTRALQSEPHGEAYAASKGGLIALSHALAASLAPDVRVNAISPGWIETGPWQKASKRRAPEHSERDRNQHWSGRVGVPEDVAELALFLASDRAGFITGQNFVVDGGMTRKMIYVE
jgi:NAD(P)-dependent dehydrogenase (short-subunit alcohol dehydrogenase family)